MLQKNTPAEAAAPVPTFSDAGTTRLDAPFPPAALSEEARAVLAAELAAQPLHLPPEAAETAALAERLRAAFAVAEEAQIVVGRADVLVERLVFAAAAQPEAVVLAAEPDFSGCRRAAERLGLCYIGVPLKADFTPDVPAMLDALEKHKPALVYLAAPHNPTGVLPAREDVETVVRAAKGIVAIDEGFAEYGGGSFAAQAGQPENLVVLQSLGSIGLAGLDTAFAAGSPALVRKLAETLPPQGGISRLDGAAARFVLEHADVGEQVQTLQNERARIANALAEMEDVCVFHGNSGCVTARFPDAETAFGALAEQGIRVLNLNGAHPLLRHCLRLGIGTAEQNNEMLRVLGNVNAEYVLAKQSGLTAGSEALARLNAGMAKGVLLAVTLFSLLSIWLVAHYFAQLG